MSTFCSPVLLRRCVLAGLILGVSTVAQSADPPAEKAKPEAKPQKLTLFDGKSLEGWKKTDFFSAGDVKVENGMIVLGIGSSMSGVTCTRKDLPTLDYELAYEAQRLIGFDFFAAATFPVGKTHATLVNGGWGGSVTGISSIDGSDASENETGKFYDFKNKTWYKFRVRVTAERIVVQINDKQVTALTHKERRLSTRIEVDASKPLGFATWETSGAIRNIEVRPLTPDEIKATNKVD